MSDKTKKESSLSQEDLALWQEAMRGTKPQPTEKSKKTSPKKTPSGPVLPEDMDLWEAFKQNLDPLAMEIKPIPKTEIQEFSEKQIPLEPKKRAPLKIDRVVDLDKRSFDRLKKGKMSIEDTFDFHGISILEARFRLTQLVDHWREKGVRCVLLITGKGIRTPKEQESIRQNLPLWLNEPLLRPKILAFTKAQPKHGGDGAFYVLLKRKKEK